MEQDPNSQVIPSLSKPDWEPPPLEQIIRPKRSRQVSLRELLRGQVGAPKGEPPEPAGCSAQAKKEPIQTEDDDQFDVPVNVSDQAPQANEMMEGPKVNTEEGLGTRRLRLVKSTNRISAWRPKMKKIRVLYFLEL